jgi:hypothetical protein
VDTDKNLHIEHLSYEDYTQEYTDIREFISGYENWKYNKSEMYAISDFNTINSGYIDFVNSEMEFEKIVSNRRRTDIRDSKVTKFMTTDIRYCMENPDDINNGVILLSYEDVDGENQVSYANGILSKREIPNGQLAITNLVDLFGRFEGTWTTGRINDQLKDFLHTKWTMEGLETIEIKGIYPEKYFYTNMGIGKPRIKTYDYRRGITIIELKYRYNEWILSVSANEILKL